ncbi:MAG: GeBP family protein [ANME-2 cluster archaeon]|nr:GeBP family protein [ANME-2 cluster archaeon]MBC2747785.1 GeBP family protein [ANME-2 cluster archaeon]
MVKKITLMASDSKPYKRGSSSSHLFSWDDIPGNDTDRFIEFLKHKFSIDWITTELIEKIDNDRVIRASFENKSFYLRLNDEETHVYLKIDDDRADKFDVKEENGKLNLYGSNRFTGCLGVCLSFTNPVVFKENYLEFFSNYPLLPHRKVIKTYDLNNSFKNNRKDLLSCMKLFVIFLAKNDVHINVVFTTFDTNRLPDGIKKYGVGRSPTKTIKTLKFLDELNNYYSYIAPWKVSINEKFRNIDVQLDSFNGEHTKAWSELCSFNKVNVVLKGDLCNSFISSADLVAGYIDEYLALNHLHLEESTIQEAINDCFNQYNDVNFQTFYVGHEDLDKIVPHENIKINLSDYYKRPMIYIIKENFLENENKFIENSPLWDKLLNFSFEINSGIKYMSYTEDPKYIKNDDYFIYLGEKGKNEAEYIKNLWCQDVNIVSLNKI